MIEKNVIKILPSKQTSFYYFTCLPRREHIRNFIRLRKKRLIWKKISDSRRI